MNQPKFPEPLVCIECGTTDKSRFDVIYIIPEGGMLPPGPIIICKDCREALEISLTRPTRLREVKNENRSLQINI